MSATNVVQKTKASLTNLVQCHHIEITATLLHEILGYLHASIAHLIANSINKTLKQSQSLELCSACQLGKSCRLPIKHVHYKSCVPFEIVHVDPWGYICYYIFSWNEKFSFVYG